MLRRPRKGVPRKTHGLSKTKAWRTWWNMLFRCMNPKATGWAIYGGRGIRVCERWKSFDNFIADMGPMPSDEHQIDRADPNGNYEPSNCRWATRLEQGANMRKAVLLEHDGERMTMSQWDKRRGFSRGVIAGRLKRGWSVDAAINTEKEGRS